MRHLQSGPASFEAFLAHQFCESILLPIATNSVLAGVVFLQYFRKAQIWVSPSGKDSNPGTAAQPLATLARAQQKVRDLHEVARTYDYQPIRIILHGGIYPITTPLVLKPEDSGDRTNLVIFAAVLGETPVLSGGIEIRGGNRRVRYREFLS